MIRLFLRSWQVSLLMTTLTISVEASAYNEAKLYVEQLPDLNTPRTGHATIVTGNEIVVIGGHTTGFIPTPTAEYFKDGEWHEIPMSYIHDQGAFIPMKSGKIVVAGSHEKELGIGQTFTFEIYDPVTHTFDGYGCLEKKRCFAEGMEMDSGKVVITGNWYNNDCIELFDGSRQCLFVKDVAQQRSLPYILKTSADNAIIFGSYDNYAKPMDTIVIDRLSGEPFTVPLFAKWRPTYNHTGHANQDMFIGDEGKGLYAHLLTALNSEGQMAFVKVTGEQFSLLNTKGAIPMRSQKGAINWFSYVVADPKVNRAYIVGYGQDDGDRRIYVLSVDYATEPAPLTLYASEPMDSIGCRCPVLMEDGSLLMVGGTTIPGNNYTPQASALLLRFTPVEDYASSKQWIWVLLLLAVITGIVIGALIVRRRKGNSDVANEKGYEQQDDPALMEQLTTLMDTQQLYLRNDLRISDVANELGVQRSRLTDAIAATQGCSFQQFVNAYRIRHAQQLMTADPDKKMAAVCMESGFANEVNFFRVFKAITGKTPSEWKAQID